MEPLKITPIDEIEDLADGVPVLSVEGTVKYAQEVKTGTSAQGHAWDKQFFVLTNGTSEIACTMWNATDNELSKGERVHIENTQNKKGVWSGMVKGSYQKDGERKHTLEIRANQVKITQPNGRTIPENEDRRGTHGELQSTTETTDPDWPEAEKPNAGVTEARKHLMQSVNLYNLCVAAVDKAIAPNMPSIAQTSEQFQAAVASLFIEASREVWWSGKIVKSSLIEQMPIKPL